MYYENFFKLCAYTDEDIKRERPRIEKTFRNWGITEEDVERGETRIKKYYDTELEGVRRLLGVWMKEFLCLTLAGEECRKIVYSEWPGPGNILQMGMMRAAPDCYFGAPGSQVVDLVMGCIFDKLSPLLEAGEAHGMTAGKAHCALYILHVGMIAKGLIPKPDLIISAGYLCDVAGESDAMLEELFGIPVAHMDGCVDWQDDELLNFGDKQVKYAGASLRKVKEKVEEVIGVKVPDETVNQGNMDMSKLFFNYQTLVQLVGRADPLPISMANLDLAYAMLYTPLKYRAEADEALVTLCAEVKTLVDQGKGVLPKGAPRIYSLMRFYVDPALPRMIEEAGLNPCVMMMDYMLPNSIMGIAAAGRTDTFETMVEGVYRIGQMVFQAAGMLDYVSQCCEEFKVDGVIINYQYSCKLFAVAFVIRKALSEKGIPSLVVEADAYDTRQCSVAAMQTRVETFAELLKAKKEGILV